VAGVLAVMALVTGLAQGSFLMTTKGQQAWLDMSTQQIEKRSGQPITDQQAATFEKMAPFVGYLTLAGSLVAVPIVVSIEAGILFGIFTFGTGGTASFKQVLSVVAHSSMVSMLGLLLAVILQFTRGVISMNAGPANLAALLPMLPEDGFLAHFLGWFDLFRLWWIVVLAIGLGVLYKRNSRTIMLALLAVYFVIAGCAAAFMSR
jgi:hypothetical protein